MHDARRAIPSVDRLLSSAEFQPLLQEWPRELVTAALRTELGLIRDSVASRQSAATDSTSRALAERVAGAVQRLAATSLVPVINATGVVLHTNLGRAPLADAALDALRQVASGYSSLEYDVASGARGSRYNHCRPLLQQLTGAEDALVVNNNAAALVLVLNTISRRLETVVSRGELVEIGGSFRVPEIIARSGARIREIGSTNRTHVDDYRAVLGATTGALLKVHPSNFTIEGFTADAAVHDLAEVAREGGVPLVHDIGSGLLLEPEQINLPAEEPTPRASLSDGADVVTMSGDKLLGGPQCGIIVGSAHLLERMRRNPLCRALRVDKITIAALEATLRLYLDPQRALREVPVLRMLGLSRDEIAARSVSIATTWRGLGGEASSREGESAVGGGASPAARLPTSLLLVRHPELTTAELERRLRAGRPSVVARIIDDSVALDLRTVAPAQDETLAEALRRVWA